MFDIAETFITKLGVNPEQLKAQLLSIVESAATVKREIEGGKKGFQGAMSYFDQRLNVIEHNQRLIMASLGINPDGENTLKISNAAVETPKGNGADTDAGRQGPSGGTG